MNLKETPQRSLKYRGLEAAYRAFARPLMGFIVKRMGGDVEAAQEIFSKTILAAIKGWDTFEHKSSYLTWLCKIALNKMADYYKDQVNYRSRHIAPLLYDLGNLEDKRLKPDEKLVLEELRLAVRECLDKLPEEKKRLLMLRYWEDMTIGKIAEKMGISERAAEGKLYRARAELKLLIVDKYPDLK